MNRRRLLALSGVGVGVSGGYLAREWHRSRSPTLPDGMDVDTHYTTDFPTFVLEEQWEGRADWREERHHVFADADAADEAVRTTRESLTSLVDETDFDVSYLLVVQNGMQSAPDLELEGIERVDDSIHVEISINAPSSGGDDLATHTFLTRITDTKTGVPETASVDIEGYV
ncbi:hypothetical protein [Natronobacterium texcoconense]|uniref:Uncharacterized protein n=1 Tax=Natronobacterium texcoconense TaxID=1095778 RepID=A0A1H1C1E4_NATTX|nr:hypothetical protein [Natronobacterium texcoconense]SDQ58042.1 hypothetical protein SAMN04489842_1232 [Natronobacterium texcoconense]